MRKSPSLASLSREIRAGKLKATDLVHKAFGLLEEKKDYQTTISTSKDRAMKQAMEIDKKNTRGENTGRLSGIPYIAKDNFLAYSGETTAASNILKGFEAPYQATAIELLESEGAICIGKSNLDAFAHGSSTENSDFFVTKNPHDTSRVPGGSSGGSAAAVALGIVPFALGTDTGGSIRLPAAFCGVVGLKPTYGLVSRSGVVAMASSTDVVGPITTNAEDASLILDILAGKDELDATTIDRDSASYTKLDGSFKGMKVGLVKEYMGDGLEPGVREAIESSVEKIKSAGAQVSEVSLPSVQLALACYYIICPAEVASNLARYDGQRFGFSYKNARTLDESYELSRENGFGAEAKRRIMIGTHVLSSGYYDAYYKKAQLVRTKIIKEFSDVFKKYDLLVGPTSPAVAFKIGARSKDPLQMYLADIMTVAANMSGNPAISIPAGTSQGLPVGIQFIAPMKGERNMLAAAKEFEEL